MAQQTKHEELMTRRMARLKIKQEIIRAIPVNSLYPDIVVALSEVLVDFARFSADITLKPTKYSKVEKDASDIH